MTDKPTPGATTSKAPRSGKRTRWGEAPSNPDVDVEPDTPTSGQDAKSPPAKRPSRFSSQPPEQKVTVVSSAAAKRAALQKNVRDRLEKLKRRRGDKSAPLSSSTGKADGKRAKVYDLDLSITAPDFEKSATIVKKENPYLAHRQEVAAPTESVDVDTVNEESSEVLLDTRLGQTEKTRKSAKQFQFATPGHYIELANKKRLSSQNALFSGFLSGRKVGKNCKSVGLLRSYGEGVAGVAEQAEEVSTSVNLPPRKEWESEGAGMPFVMEWWDVELLPAKLRKEVVSKEQAVFKQKARKRMDLKKNNGSPTQDPPDFDTDLFDKCYSTASTQHSKTSTLVQHPPSIPSTNAPDQPSDKPASQPILHLTKKEMKRQRKLRRAAKQTEIQDLQAAGVLPPQEPRLTLGNFMRVLGDQAVMDPSKMEQKVLSQIQARKIQHEKMNEERKLTPLQKAEKRRKKLDENLSDSNCTRVALFLVHDMTHRYHRTKVDLNAVQNSITGAVLECEEGPKVALVIAEGGPKAIKRFTRLMTVRMKWKGEQFRDDAIEEVPEEDGNSSMSDKDDDEDGATAPQKFNDQNYCKLLWTGLVAKRMFHSFVFQSCPNSETVRKVLDFKNVGHYWDQVLVHLDGKMSEEVHFALGDSYGVAYRGESEDEDIVMRETPSILA